MSKQITNKIWMVRPANFGFNAETAVNNSFQRHLSSIGTEDILKQAIIEFDNMVDELRANGIDVKVWNDSKSPKKMDAIFPNNWFSTHEDNVVITYPMFSPNRRLERREDLVQKLGNKRYSFEFYEKDNLFLEGTGSMILDRENKIVYACLSQRTSIEIVEKFAVLRSFSKHCFNAFDRQGKAIYHTNVIMTLGESFAVICLDSVTDIGEKKLLIEKLQSTGKEIIDISMQQVEHFAGNMLQLCNQNGERFIVMSQQAHASLTKVQKDNLKKHGSFITPNLKTIETLGGGSARCMIAENFLPL